MAEDKCSRCGNTDSETFYNYDDGFDNIEFSMGAEHIQGKIKNLNNNQYYELSYTQEKMAYLTIIKSFYFSTMGN